MRSTIFVTFAASIGLACGTAWAMPPYLQPLCQDSKYTCIKIHKGETWEALFADPSLRDLVMRLNRVNIQPKPGSQIVVPNDLVKTTLLNISPFNLSIPASGEKVIMYDPAINAWAAYGMDGKLVKWGPGSSGKDFCPDIASGCRTITGEYAVYLKGGAYCASSKYPVPHGGAPMQYCMFFNKGYALHASNDVPGYNASHGCVRMFLKDARWLNQEFVELPNKSTGQHGTKVIIRDYPLSS